MALGFVLMIFEIVLPSYFFLWLGGAAIAVGVVLLAAPDLPFIAQGGLFAALGIVAFYMSRRFIKERKNQPHNKLNKRGAGMIGTIVILETAIEHGRGSAKIGDSVWAVTSTQDLPAGSAVKIIAADGATLTVEKA